MGFLDYMKRRVAGLEEGCPAWLGEKAAVRTFADSIGVAQPELLATGPSIDDIDFAALPDRFVIKPDGLHSGQGVHLLTRIGPDRFRDQMKGQEISVDFLREEYEQLRPKLQVPAHYKVIVEEWVTGEKGLVGPIPPDFKLYVFYDRVKLIQQVNRNVKPIAIGWYDGNFRPLRIEDCMPSMPRIYAVDRLTLPRRWKDVLRMARKTSVAMQTPFTRIDIFVSDRGPLLGEVTLAPGGAGYSYPFAPAYDRKLGKAWERAEKRLAEAKAENENGRSGKRRKSGRTKPHGGRKHRRRQAAATGRGASSKTRRP